MGGEENMVEESAECGGFPEGTEFFQGSEGEYASINPGSFKSEEDFIKAKQELRKRFPRSVNAAQFNKQVARDYYGMPNHK
jgi:hypothetical protein